MRLFLVRHGQTAWNAAQKAQGHADIPLDEDGEEQARRLVAAFDDHPLGVVIASDLQRAYQTAEPVAQHHGALVRKWKDLRERSFGDWEGSPFEDIARRFLELEQATGLPRARIAPPGGESLLDVWNRLDTVVEELLEISQPTLIVTHGGTCSILLAKLLQGTLETALCFRFGNTSVTSLTKRPGGFHLNSYNDTSHLRERALAGSVDGVSK